MIIWATLVDSYKLKSSSIKCYECNSQNNSMCLDPKSYDRDTLDRFLPTVNCGEEVLTTNHHGFFCRKIIQNILKKGYAPDIRVTRSCGWIRHHRDCYKADNEDHTETVCQCFTDDCNAARSIDGKYSVLITAFSALGLKYVMN
ncbi:hypothetical protein K1T71_009566 [Dendrolimus kikuchii]|uniref:Uncharacterized protein n=1 Tax=Dendrolimus kikuchii TaxID=765133 RepID=A0ACC1CS20_9NEOP|nr:hypothetical protein K1T71_009566 [Dendrolimus kikuchii]